MYAQLETFKPVLRAILPGEIRAYLLRVYYELRFRQYVRSKFVGRYRRQASGPLPPPELITTEALMTKDELRSKSSPGIYFGRGYSAALHCLSKLERSSCNLHSLQSALEFGCGSGRVIRHFRNIGGLKLEGTDANLKPIEWCRQNLSGVRFYTNALQPPLAFANDEAFDLVCAFSVFTHIPLEWQRPWLEELRRVLRPGGYLYCSVAGSYHINRQLDANKQAELEREGALTLGANDEGASYSTQILPSWDVFQTREQVQESFGSVFELLHYTRSSDTLDALVLRKPGALLH
jgi:SAM-dependent methyltransferase